MIDTENTKLIIDSHCATLYTVSSPFRMLGDPFSSFSTFPPASSRSQLSPTSS